MAGTKTRLQMVGEVLDNMAKSGSLTLGSGTLLSSRAVDYLNRAQFLIARQQDILQAIATSATVANQLSYSLPSRFRSVFDLRLEDGVNTRKLTCILPQNFDERIPKPSIYTASLPWFYVPYKDTGTFELFPIPDQVYTLRLRYSYFPAALSTDGQTSDYSDLDDALIAFATMYGFRWMQELKDAVYWEAIGTDVLKQHKTMRLEQYPDWTPVSEGFGASGGSYTGEYWNNPFIGSVDANNWWR